VTDQISNPYKHQGKLQHYIQFLNPSFKHTQTSGQTTLLYIVLQSLHFIQEADRQQIFG